MKKKLFATCMACLLMPAAGWAVDNGTYYLYNVGAGKWMNFGNPQGQTATFFRTGTPIRITDTGSGYTLQCPFYDANNYLTAGTVLGASATFAIQEVGQGVYTIQGANGLLGYDGTTNLDAAPYSNKVLSNNLADATSDNAHWLLLTADALKERLQQATADAPVDATFLIQSPNFHRHDAGCYDTAPNGHLVWTGMAATNHGYSGYTNNYNGFIFNESRNIYQDLSGLPAGVYEVSVQGFSRYGSNTDATGTYAGTTPQATLYAGDQSTPMMKLTDDLAHESGFYDNNKKYADGYVPYFNNDGGKTNSTSNSEAGKAFDYGMYSHNHVRVTVGGDGNLRIGINVPADARTNSWTAFDNFELKYFGPLSTITDEQIQSLLASVPTGPMNAAVRTALDQAVAAFDADKSVDNYNALSAAVADARTSAQAYASIQGALAQAQGTTLSDEARAQYDAAVADIVSALADATISGDGQAELTAIQAALDAAQKLDISHSDDKTGLIVNPRFDDGKNGWSGDFGTGAVKATSTNPLITAYGGTFDVYQDITGLAPGTYRVQVQAFSRPMDHNDMKTALSQGKTLDNQTYLYANDREKLVHLITDEYGTTSAWGAEFETGKYVPNSSGDAAQAFNAGMYQNELLCVVTDGTLRIGIRQESTEGTPYVGYDNFRLTYVSADTELPEEEEQPLRREDIMAWLSSCNRVAQQATDHAAFDQALAEAQQVLKAEDCTEEQMLQAQADVTAALATLMRQGETQSGQFDLTPLIANATFDANLDGWNTARPFAWNSIGVAQLSGAQAGARISQVLKGMPAGRYTLKVQGFYRQSGWKEGLYEYEHGHRLDAMTLFLNDAQKPVKSLFQDGRSSLASANVSRSEDVGSTIDGRGFPHLMSKVQDVFKPGNYWNYIEVDVTQDGDITLGVNLDETDRTDNWAVLDNFRLYYGQLKPVLLTRTNYRVQDDTPADVRIVKKFTAGTLTPFSAPCDVPGSAFQAVYEVGSVDYATRSMTLYPVENVRAGVPCCVVASADIDTLTVGHTVISAAEADLTQLPWDGGLIAPVFSTFNWRNTDYTGTERGSGIFREVTYADPQQMQFTVNIQNYQVRRFLGVKYGQSTASVISDYNQPAPARRDLAHSVPVPVPASMSQGAVVHYSLNPDMSDALSLSVQHGATLCYIPNLVPGNTYYYQVQQGAQVLSQGQFTVQGPLRQLYAPSIYNIRDLGGWTMQDGSVTRYGLVYRGGEVNGFHAPYQPDVETLKQLGIGAEIDLRFNDSYDQDRETNKSGFGFQHGSTYYFAGANDYTADNLKDPATQGRIRDEFRFLLGHIRQGSGVYFHCVFGADRTGFFAMLLEGLLGFTLNDLYHDYELTSFAAPAGNRNKSSIQERIAVIQAQEGKTLRDKFENYWLHSVGITPEEVAEFRSLMLIDAASVGVQDAPAMVTDATLQAVYTIGGVRVPSASRPGIYVLRYSDGRSRRVVVR